MKQSTRVRVIVGLSAVAVVVVLAMILTQGGGTGANLVSGSALAEAASTTERVPGASESVEAKIEVEGLPKPLVMRLKGIQDMRHRRAHLVGSYSNFPAQVPGQSADGTLPLEIISILPDIYMKSPIFDKALPPGKSWVHIDVAAAGRRIGIGDPTQFGSSDPTQILQNLRALSTRVERVGGEAVRGVPTTHYRAKVELRRLPAVVPAARRTAARQNASRLIQLLGSDSYPIDVWIDRRRLVRRMRFVMKMKIPQQDRSMTQDITTELYDFGPKQKTKAPPAGEAYDAPQPPTTP